MTTKPTLYPNAKKLILTEVTPQMSHEEIKRNVFVALKAQGINVVKRPPLDDQQERNEA